MLLGPDVLILTNIGVKSVSELYRDYVAENKLPEALTYDTHFKVLKYKPITKVAQTDDVELYTSKYYDIFMSKMTALASSRDTEILRYDIVPTKKEQIIGGSYNVYAYLKNNWKAADPEFEPISSLLNHGAIAPNLASGDLVVKFIERKVLVSDFAYTIYTSDNKAKAKKKDSEPKLDTTYEVLPVFASQSFQFNYNFIFVR